jgi:hypothetical protein
MLTKIVEQLKTGNITNVIPYGSIPIPSAPYVVVKPELDILGRGRSFRIIVHMLPGQQIFLDDYVNGELETLLYDFAATTRNGNYNQLYREPIDSDISISNDDGTISMERVFMMPSRID